MLQQGQILRPLFDFDAIVDFPMSIARMIREEFGSSKYFLNLEDEYWLKCMFRTMDNKDPMPLLLTDKYKNRCDGLYDEFLKDSKLSKYYTTYPIADILKIFNLNGFVDSTIVAHNNSEIDFIRKYYRDKVKIMKYNGKPLSINNKYGAYYTSDINNIITKLDNPKYIVFHIMRFKYNMEHKEGIELLKYDVIKDVHKSNKFIVMDPYNDIKLPEEE